MWWLFWILAGVILAEVGVLVFLLCARARRKRWELPPAPLEPHMAGVLIDGLELRGLLEPETPSPSTVELLVDGKPPESGGEMAGLRLTVRRKDGDVERTVAFPPETPVVIGRTTHLDRYRPGWFLALHGNETRTPRSYVEIKVELGENGEETMFVKLLADGYSLKVDGEETRTAGTVLTAKAGSRIELEPDWVFEVCDQPKTSSPGAGGEGR